MRGGETHVVGIKRVGYDELALAVDRRHLACEATVIDAGAAPDPTVGITPAQRGAHRRGDGRVADAHLADHEHVRVAAAHRDATLFDRFCDLMGDHA